MGNGDPLTEEEREYIRTHGEQATFGGTTTYASRGYKPTDSDPKTKVKGLNVFRKKDRVGNSRRK